LRQTYVLSCLTSVLSPTQILTDQLLKPDFGMFTVDPDTRILWFRYRSEVAASAGCLGCCARAPAVLTTLGVLDRASQQLDLLQEFKLVGNLVVTTTEPQNVFAVSCRWHLALCVTVLTDHLCTICIGACRLQLSHPRRHLSHRAVQVSAAN
jgi:hypothetical protein